LFYYISFCFQGWIFQVVSVGLQQKALEAAMTDINSSFGKGSVTRLGSAGGALVWVLSNPSLINLVLFCTSEGLLTHEEDPWCQFCFWTNIIERLLSDITDPISWAFKGIGAGGVTCALWIFQGDISKWLPCFGLCIRWGFT
jgi:hypothetical protein